MKNLKKNQIVIFVIALMLVFAGYLNYTNIQYAGIGDAKLVSANSTENNNVENNIENDIDNSDTIDNIIETSSNEEDNQYFTKSRLERETMFSQMLESYEKILENTNIPSDQKSIAQTEIKRINDLKNAIMISENLIKTKGFEDVIIFANDISISVIVKGKDIGQEQVAQIQNIVAREMKQELENIHISGQ